MKSLGSKAMEVVESKKRSRPLAKVQQASLELAFAADPRSSKLSGKILLGFEGGSKLRSRLGRFFKNRAIYVAKGSATARSKSNAYLRPEATPSCSYDDVDHQ